MNARQWLSAGVGNYVGHRPQRVGLGSSVFVPAPRLKMLITSIIIGSSVRTTFHRLVFCHITLTIRSTEMKFVWLWNSNYRNISHLPITSATYKSDLEQEVMSRGFRVLKWRLKHVQQFRNTQDCTSLVMCPGSDPQCDAIACRLFTSSRSWNTHTSSRGCSSDLLTLKFAYAMFICSYSVDHTP